MSVAGKFRTRLGLIEAGERLARQFDDEFDTLLRRAAFSAAGRSDEVDVALPFRSGVLMLLHGHVVRALHFVSQDHLDMEMWTAVRLDGSAVDLSLLLKTREDKVRIIEHLEDSGLIPEEHP